MQNARIAWAVAGVLAVILLIVLFVKMGSGSSAAQVRETIERNCLATDSASLARCSQDLSELADTLSRFSQNFGTTTEPAQ